MVKRGTAAKIIIIKRGQASIAFYEPEQFSEAQSSRGCLVLFNRQAYIKSQAGMNKLRKTLTEASWPSKEVHNSYFFH
jgi:hypothetical protein